MSQDDLFRALKIATDKGLTVWFTHDHISGGIEIKSTYQHTHGTVVAQTNIVDKFEVERFKQPESYTAFLILEMCKAIPAAI